MNRSAIFFVTAFIFVLSACSSAPNSGDARNDGEEVTLTVFAAASLTDTFTELGSTFEADNPSVTVSFNFAGSSDLVAQIQDGAPADVFASADTKNMDKAVDGDVVADEPVLFATNTLMIATPPENPANIKTFADLATPGVKLVVCAPQVPCGTAAVAVAQSAGETLSPVSEEQSVTDVLGKVRSGDADAGLVYVTDVASAGGGVLGIEFPEASGHVNEYPVVGIKHSEHVDVAHAFIEFLTSAEAQAVFAAAGFGKP